MFLKDFHQLMRLFACLYFAHNHITKGDKFASQRRKCIFVGYPWQERGKLYDLDNKEFFLSRDVKFFEEVFPFLTPSILIPSLYFLRLMNLFMKILHFWILYKSPLLLLSPAPHKTILILLLSLALRIRGASSVLDNSNDKNNKKTIIHNHL